MRTWQNNPLVQALRIQGGLWRDFLVRAGDVQADILLTVAFVVAGASWLAARVAIVRFYPWRRGEPAWLARPAAEHDLAWMERQG